MELLVGESVAAPLYIGATGRPGLTAVRFRIAEGASADITAKVRINGRESNAVTIAVRAE